MHPDPDFTLDVVVRAQLISTFARHLRPHAVSALDIGCGGGQLAEALCERSFRHYVGVDVSRVAIELAQTRMNADRARFPRVCQFQTGQLGSYSPSGVPEGGFDLLVLSEVLYYLPTPGDALSELKQSAQWLNNDGVISISLKDDGKSHAIMRKVASSFNIVSSFLCQRNPSFRIKIDLERPASLISMLTPRL